MNNHTTHPRSSIIQDISALPAFEVIFTAPPASTTAILIPVINEGERIINQLLGMKKSQLGLDIILVDGGSTDGSMDPERLQKELGINTLLLKTGAGKLSAQLRIGLAFSLQQGYNSIITIDGNGKDDYHAIPLFAAKLHSGYDHVQGSRYLPGGTAVNTPRDREWAVRLLHAPVISLGAGFKYTDTTNGFRGYSRRFLLDARVRPFRQIFNTYNLPYYLAVRAPRLGFKVCEVPVTRSYPASGAIPSKIHGVKGKLHILKQMFLAALGAYKP